MLGQLPDGVLPDAVVGGVGTGGTIVGVGRPWARSTRCQVVAVEPNESCTLMCDEIGRHLIEASPRQPDETVEHVVTFFCDEGEKYLNDYFLARPFRLVSMFESIA